MVKKIYSMPGSVLPLAMLAVVVLFVVGMGLLALGKNAQLMAIRTGHEIKARCAADAGLVKAVYKMNDRLRDGTFSDSSLPQETDSALPGSDETFSYNVTKPGDYTVESTGKSARVKRTVSAVLRLKGLGEYAVLVKDTLVLKSGTIVRGYNSSDPAADTEVKVEIGTVSTLPDRVVLNNGSTVDGDVLVGFGGDVENVVKDLGATVTGDMHAITEEMDFPAVEPPSLLLDMGKITVHGETMQIGPLNSGRYTSVSLKRATSPAVLEIAGGDVELHVTGNISLGQDCDIILREGASLSLYVDGDILADEGSGFINENAPGAFKLWGTGSGEPKPQQFQLNAKSELFGQVYAPNADLTVMAKGDLYGAFTANSFEMKAGGNIYYDEALRNVGLDDEGVRFVIKRWSE